MPILTARSSGTCSRVSVFPSYLYLGLNMPGLPSQDRMTLLGEQMDGFEAPEDPGDGGYELSVPAGEEGELSSHAGDEYALSQDVLDEINEYVLLLLIIS